MITVAIASYYLKMLICLRVTLVCNSVLMYRYGVYACILISYVQCSDISYNNYNIIVSYLVYIYYI